MKMSHYADGSTNHRYVNRAALLERLNAKRMGAKNHKLELEVQKAIAAKEKGKLELPDGDAKTAVTCILNAHDKGLLEGGKYGVAMSLLAQCASNIGKRKRGRRHTAHRAAMMVYEVALFNAGPTFQRFLATNLIGPLHRDTIMAELRKLPEHTPGTEGARRIFPALKEVYRQAMEANSLELGTVLCEISEDETNVIAKVQYNRMADSLGTLCGTKGADYPKTHRCIDGYQFVIGNGPDAHDNIIAGFEQCAVSSYARVMMISPWHKKLPKVAVLIMPCCNRFDHKLVRRQWGAVDALYREHLSNIIGPCVGNASDGDSRRRMLQLEGI